MEKWHLKRLKWLVSVILSWTVTTVIAADVGLGTVANNLMDPVTVFSDFIYSGCIILGASFLFASLIKYFEHKRSPLMVPISTVLFLLIAGIVLILLPFLPYLIDSGVPYALLS